MAKPYHKGELAVQTQAGVLPMAGRIANSIKDFVPPAAKEFLLERTFAVVGTVDANGAVWASLIQGGLGFLEAIDDHTVRIETVPHSGDPWFENIGNNPHMGMIAIEFQTRRRMRINGNADRGERGEVYLRVQQVYANCPKYIHPRFWKPQDPLTESGGEIRRTDSVDLTQREFIESSDTFFIATHHAESGCDVSHRGGAPGFVRFISNDILVFPDYSGNTMFQTLGNLNENPHCGLLFLDFNESRRLQLTGTARIIWDAEIVKQFENAERVVEFRIDQILELGSIHHGDHGEHGEGP